MPPTCRPDWRPAVRAILQNNIAFMDDCAKNGVITMADVQDFAKQQGPNLKQVIAWAAQTQVEHWMDVIGDWKKMLGADWDKTYAASNTIYVARQNNVLFSVLAQYFGPEAINDRLMLIETISFTTTPQDMLESMTRIIADRSVGAIFFGNYHLMDYELMGGDARATIIAEDAKRGIAAGAAASGAVRLASMADADHAGPGRRVARRSAVKDGHEPQHHPRGAAPDLGGRGHAVARRLCLARRRHLAVLRAAAAHRYADRPGRARLAAVGSLGRWSDDRCHLPDRRALRFSPARRSGRRGR